MKAAMADDLSRSTSDLYERDIVAWAEVQASALRSRNGGENALDYDNLAEEIEDVGKSQQRACRSHVERIIEHLLKLELIASTADHPHWRGEVLAFRNNLHDDLTPTLNARLPEQLPELFRRQLLVLERRQLLDAAALTLGAQHDGYTWDQIVDPDWYPAPRYEG